jgi:hypothetical protein
MYRLLYPAYAILGAVLALLMVVAACESRDYDDSKHAAPTTTQPAPALPAADASLVNAKADLAAAEEKVKLALAGEKTAKEEKAKADQATAVAPLAAILHVAEGLAVTAIILGVVEIIASMILTSLQIGKTLGECMIASGVGVLLTCGLLQGALDHAKLILCWSAAALIVWGIVWLKRTGKLATVLGIAHDSYALAISALRTAGKHAEADAIEAGHALKVAEHDLAGWVHTLLVKLHVIKTATAAPAAPAAPIQPLAAPGKTP